MAFGTALLNKLDSTQNLDRIIAVTQDDNIPYYHCFINEGTWVELVNDIGLLAILNFRALLNDWQHAGL